MTPKDDTKRLVVELNERLKEDFKRRVEAEGRTMSWVIERYIKEYTYDREPVDNR